jgi:ribosomal protein S18 acetylase RimI-like enzyme
MFVETFQYPENPEWSVQPDEAEDITQTVRSLKRMWPLLRILQVLSPQVRDMLRGYLWEEQGHLAAAVLVQRIGSTPNWVVGTVGVLPSFRRRGLARILLTQSLDYIRGRNGRRVVLGVIDRNVPAYSLYRSLGFAHFGGTVEYDQEATDPGEPPRLPAGYENSKLARSDWRTRFELDQRITPDEERQYVPVEKGRYRQPLPVRLISPISSWLQGKQERDFVIRSKTSGDAVGRYGYRICRRAKGVCSVRAKIDPAHPELAAYAVGMALRAVAEANPKRRVQFFAERWQPALAEAAEAYGFAKRVEYHELGLIL